MLYVMQMVTGMQKGDCLRSNTPFPRNCILEALWFFFNIPHWRIGKCNKLFCNTVYHRCELELKKCSALEESKWKGKKLIVYDRERHTDITLSVNQSRWLCVLSFKDKNYPETNWVSLMLFVEGRKFLARPINRRDQEGTRGLQKNWTASAQKWGMSPMPLFHIPNLLLTCSSYKMSGTLLLRNAFISSNILLRM